MIKSIFRWVMVAGCLAVCAKAGSLPDGWSSADVGAISPAGTQSYASETARFDLSGAGADIGGTADQFHCVYESWTGDGQWIVQVSSLQNTHVWAKAGLMVRADLTPGSPHAMLALTPGNGVAFLRRPVVKGASLNASVPGTVAPGWLKLVRRGNQFDTYTSPDGQTWTYWTSDIVTMPANVLVGLAVTSRKAGTLAKASFTGFDATVPLPPDFPSGWTSQDIGSPALSGSADYLAAGGLLKVRGAGTDIWGAADQFQFVGQPWTGDAVVIARVDSLRNTNAWAKAGVMIRESLAAGACNAFVAISPGYGVTFQYRTATGGSSSRVVAAGVTAPVWVKLERWGDRFDAFYAIDGLTWKYVGSATVPMAADVELGLAATSRNAKALTEAVFSHFDYRATGVPGGLWGEYFKGKAFNTPVLQRLDGVVNFNWGSGSPAPVVPADGFSVRWTGSVVPDVTQSYTFSTYSDDGVRLWVNDRLLIDNWTNHGGIENTGALTLTAGTPYSVKMEYYENAGGATARLLWAAADRAKTPIAAVYLKPSRYPDADADGIPDYWEKLHGLDPANPADARTVDPEGRGLTYLQEYLIATHPDSPDTDGDGVPDIADPFPADYYDGDTPTVTVIGGDQQSALVTTFNASPFDIAVWKSDGSGPLVNAPVSFSVASGSGLLSLTTSSPPTSGPLSVRTDVDGAVQAHYRQPAAAGVTSRITVTAGAASTTLTTTSLAEPVPKGGTAGVISPTQVLLSWSGATTGTSYTVERRNGDGGYQIVAVLENTLSYLDTGLAAGHTYGYRIKAQSRGVASDYSDLLTATTLATGADFPLSRLRTWLKADAGVITSNTGVSLWLDQSGHGNDATQSDPGSQPQAVTNQINGQTVIRFDGSGTQLNLPDIMNGATEGEVIIVGRVKDFSRQYNGLAHFGTGYGTSYSEDNGGWIWDDFGNEDGSPIDGPGSAVLTAPHIYNSSMGADGISITRFNGVTLAQRENETVSFRTDPILGADWLGEYFNGDIAEVLVFDHALTDAERIAVETWLNVRYAIIPPPDEPTNVTIQALSPTQISLSWSGDASSSYTIERKTGNGEYMIMATVSNASSYSDDSVAAGQTYKYRIKAKNKGRYSGYSAEKAATTPPSAPANLTAQAQSSTQVGISWMGDAGSVYAVERKNGSGAYAVIATVSNALGYVDGDIAIGQTYTYRIKAQVNGLYSDYSAENSVTIPDVYTGQAFVITVVSGDDQTGDSGKYLAAPIVVRATLANGTPLANAPLICDVVNGTGTLSSSTEDDSQATDSISLQTDAQGYATFNWKLTQP